MVRCYSPFTLSFESVSLGNPPRGFSRPKWKFRVPPSLSGVVLVISPHEHRTHIHLRPCDLGRSLLVPIKHDGRFGIVPKRSEVLVGSLTPSPPLLISFHPTLVGGAFLGGSSPSAEAGIFKIFSNLRPCDLGCSRQDVHSFGRCCGRVISVAVCCRSNSCLANQLDLYDQFPKFFSKPWPCDLG